MAPVDCFALSEPAGAPDGNEDVAIADVEFGMFLVADGMGGRPGGATASAAAASAFREALRRRPRRRLAPEALRGAVAAANAAVLRLSASRPEFEGMGTTLTAVVLAGRRGKVVHVGDSRAYHYADGQLRQLTRDHTLIAELVARALISEERARRSRLRHLLSRAIGTSETVEPDIEELNFLPSQWLLLATDGLYGVLGEERIRATMTANARGGAEGMCRALVEAALDARARDNVTAVVVRAAEAPEH